MGQTVQDALAVSFTCAGTHRLIRRHAMQPYGLCGGVIHVIPLPVRAAGVNPAEDSSGPPAVVEHTHGTAGDGDDREEWEARGAPSRAFFVKPLGRP